MKLSEMDEWETALLELVLDGDIEDTGIRRPNEQGIYRIVYRITTQGRRRAEESRRADVDSEAMPEDGGSSPERKKRRGGE